MLIRSVFESLFPHPLHWIYRPTELAEKYDEMVEIIRSQARDLKEREDARAERIERSRLLRGITPAFSL
jgi:hypothetical protein